MSSVDMDFCYASLALLLFVHGCVGQDNPDVSTAGTGTLGIEVNIDPPYSSMQKNLGESLVLTCSVSTSSSETPSLKWMFGAEEITEKSAVERIHVQEMGTSYLLRIDPIEDNDTGTYTCVAALGGEESRKDFRLEIVKPLVIKSETDQHGIFGTNGKVMCDVSAKPPPETSWRFANGTGISKSDKFIIEQDHLLVKNLDFSDEGKYICDIIIKKTGVSKKLVIDYVVVEIPTINVPPTIEPQNAKVGDEVKIHCKAEGRPKPTYTFTKDGSPITNHEIDETAGILTIKKLERSDEASYTCIASNVGGSVDMSNTLDVKIPPVISAIADVPDAVEKGLQTIECIAKGDPVPQVSWRMVGMDLDYTTTQTHPKITVESNSLDTDRIKEVKSTMTFDGVKASDAGSYRCTAVNAVGTDNKTVKMEVQYGPHFDVPFKKSVFYGWTGHSANLTCQASGNPPPSISWKRSVMEANGEEKWEELENGDPFNLNSQINDAENKITTRSLFVFINGNDVSLYGKYMCVASNYITNANKTVTLVQATAPSMPEFSFANTLSTMVTISIQKPQNDGGQPVKSYKYMYHIDGDEGTLMEDSTDVAGDRTSVTVKSLKPDTTYLFKVVAKNNVGSSSEKTMTVTTNKVSKPSKMSITSDRTSDKALSYNIEWAQPDDGGSPITKFIIKYKEVKVKVAAGQNNNAWQILSDVDTDFQVKEVTDTNAMSYELTGLHRDSYYDLRLTAINGEGESTPEHLIIKTIKGSSGSSSGASSAGLGSGLIIAIVIIVIIIILAAVIIAVVVLRRKRAARGGDAEGGKAEDGKSAAEAEKLIQKDAKVENENEKGDGIEEKQEFEPDQKPEAPVATDAADEKPTEETPAEPTIKITPDTPDKPENPSA